MIDVAHLPETSDARAPRPAVTTAGGVAAPARGWSATDRGMARLVRLILADDWRPAEASARLREYVGDPRVLRRMAARVQRATVERPSAVAERAARTLDGALGETPPA
ncbi:MAG TPA: hypothetical protein VFI47_15095 [Acidimicrobiales bacterium]|nr:hypothetical protein [Acidimicrobiales bacterium]